MPMSPFLERFPELGAREGRSVTIRGRNDLPDGEYGFIELYCDEPHCDCRRVTIAVLRPHTGWKFWATISYGWESLAFYQKWSKSPELLDPREWKGPYLDPLGEQTQYSPALLNLFHVVLASPGYVERLKRHYRLFRTAVEKECKKSSQKRSRQTESPQVSGKYLFLYALVIFLIWDGRQAEAFSSLGFVEIDAFQ